MSAPQDRLVTLKNGVQMPLIGLGTSLRGKAKIESDAFVESVKHAIKIGYRHIDTVKIKVKFGSKTHWFPNFFEKAKIYNNEHLVGKAIKECGVSRDELFIVTKLYPEDMGFEKGLKAFEKSCKLLQVDYVGKSQV